MQKKRPPGAPVSLHEWWLQGKATMNEESQSRGLAVLVRGAYGATIQPPPSSRSPKPKAGVEERREGVSGTQPFVYQKQPESMFPSDEIRVQRGLGRPGGRGASASAAIRRCHTPLPLSYRPWDARWIRNMCGLLTGCIRRYCLGYA